MTYKWRQACCFHANHRAALGRKRLNLYICDFAGLALLSARNDLHHISSLHMHRQPDRLAILVQVVVLPFLARALHQGMQ